MSAPPWRVEPCGGRVRGHITGIRLARGPFKLPLVLWPFDHTRYFAPRRPIPVSPIGLGYVSAYGMIVAVFEIVVFSPLW